MSVYTSLTRSEVEQFLAGFTLGTYVAHRGISAGIENTNYFVTTSHGEFVLTLFEHQQADEVRDIMRLAHHLGNRGLKVPAPVSDQQGVWLHELKHKPTIICPKLSGTHIEDPQPTHCLAIGTALAELHLAARDLENPRADIRDYHWWLSAGPQLTSSLSAADQTLLTDELNFQTQQRAAWLQLPHGWMHGDLFHDNALFDNEHTVGAILDLYNASSGAWLYDLAVVANDWCSEKSGNWKAGCIDALLEGYSSVRPLTAHEQSMWHTVLRAGALRFWLSRLLTRQHQQQHLQQQHSQQESGELALQKDPNEYRLKLLKRRAQLN